MLTGVSADWLLGLPDRGSSSTNATANGAHSIAVAGAGAKVTVGDRTPTNCDKCKYRRFAEAFNALQKPD